MELIVNLQIERLPEGPYLATSEEVPGLVVQGRTVAETLEISRDVARKLIEARRDHERSEPLQQVSDSFRYPLVVGS